jgi:integrase
MYLLVQPHGARLWRLKYRHSGHERVYSIGVYDEVGLAAARAERDRARQWVREGKDPTIERRVAKVMEGQQQALTFSVLAEEWFGQKSRAWSAAHRVAQRTRLDNDLLPHLGAVPIKDVSPALVLETLRRIQRRGAHETAAKCRIIVSQVFRYAAQTSRAESDPAALLGGALTRPPSMHRATIPLEEMPGLFAALLEVPSELVTKLALYWLILTAARTHEMRFATWREIEGGKLWRVPAERMKMRKSHVVPLSREAMKVLHAAEPLRNEGALLFPGFTKAGTLSENALLSLLARAGYYGRQTSHGFRASFSTWAHEAAEADPDVVEACLAHVSGDVRAVYNRATYLSKRKALLQAWADQCVAWGMRV